MLSSLGARRDRSRSPPDGHPPSKVFVQAKELESDVGHRSQVPNTKSDSQCHETFVPKIVVQEYMQEKGPSPTMPFTYAQALMQKRSESTGQQTSANLKLEADVKESPVQQYQQHKGVDITQSVQYQEVWQQQQVSACTQQQKQKTPASQKQQQQELHKYEVQQTTVTFTQQAAEVEQRSEYHKQTPVSKAALSSQELKSRKAKAMKNRPWLQKPVSGECPPDVEKQVSVQGTIQTIQTQVQLKRETERSAHTTPEPTAVTRYLPEEQVQAPERPQQQQTDKERSKKELENSKEKPKEVKHHELVAPPQQQLSQQEKKHKQKKQSRKPEQQQTVHIVKQSDISLDTTVQSVNLSMAQLDQRTEAKNLPHPQTPVQPKSQAAVPENAKSTSVTHSVTDGQPPLRVTPANQGTQGKSQKQDHSKSQVPTLLQPGIPEAPQPSTLPQGIAPGLAVSQPPAWSQVRSLSPMQVSAQGQFPVSSHIQVRTHPQSWAPVRPPSPKPPQISSPMPVQSGSQNQILFQSVTQPPTHLTSTTHSQAYIQSVPQTQAYAQLIAQQSHSSPLIQQAQDPFGVQPGAQHSAVQHQSHSYSWNQVQASSPMPIHDTSYPEGYSQSQAMRHQWIPEKTLQTQPVGQQGYLVSQPYPQHTNQAPKSETHSCWPQSGSQVDPQMGPHGYTHTAYSQSHVQMHNIPWTQTPPQAISGYQQPTMRGYEVFQTQTHQSQVQQQPWSHVPPQMQPQSYPQSQSQQDSLHLAQRQAQSLMQTQTPFQLQTQIQPQPQSSPHAKPKTDLPPHSQKQPQYPGPQVQHVQNKQFQQPLQPQKPPSKGPNEQNNQAIQLHEESLQKAEPASKLQGESVLLSEAPKPPAQMPPEPKVQAKSLPQPKSPVELQVNVLPRSLPESPDLCVTPPALAQAPPQAYTEAYAKAQALARNGFEEAKHCLQEHIRETINVFEDKHVSAKQGALKKVNAHFSLVLITISWATVF